MTLQLRCTEGRIAYMFEVVCSAWVLCSSMSLSCRLRNGVLDAACQHS